MQKHRKQMLKQNMFLIRSMLLQPRVVTLSLQKVQLGELPVVALVRTEVPVARSTSSKP